MTSQVRVRRSRTDAQQAARPASSHRWRDAAIVFALAMAVRVAHVWQLKSAPFFVHLLGDSRGYDAWAQRLAAGDWIGHDVFYQAPLYPYFLGVVYWGLGRDLLVVRLIQAGVGALTCATITLAGWKLFGRRAGIASGLLLACYAPAVFFDALIQKTVLDGFLIAALLLVVAELRERITTAMCVAGGLLIGLVALNRENALVLLPVLLVWLWTRAHRIAPLAIATLATLLALSPVALRNWAVSDRLYLTTSQLGPNFYIGNHEGAPGTYVSLRPGRGSVEYEKQDATEIAEEAAGRPLDPSEVSRYWVSRAIGWIASHPGEWLRITARKFLLIVNATEAADTEDRITHGEWSVVLRLANPILNFGVLGPLALLGIWLTRRRGRDLWPYLALCGVYAFSVALFFVLDRYRYPIVPFVVLFAGAAVAELGRQWNASSAGGRSAIVGVTVAAAVVCNWPILSAADKRALTHYNIGAALQRDGINGEAIAEYRIALGLKADLPDAHSDLGVLLSESGDETEALEHCREAVRLSPERTAAHVNLGVVLARAGNTNEAIAEFRRALELYPSNAEAHYNLGLALAGAGQTQAAIGHLREAIRIAPSNAAAHNNLGVLLCSAGILGDGIREFETALKLKPDFPEASANLEHARDLQRQGIR